MIGVSFTVRAPDENGVVVERDEAWVLRNHGSENEEWLQVDFELLMVMQAKIRYLERKVWHRWRRFVFRRRACRHISKVFRRLSDRHGIWWIWPSVAGFLY